MEHSELLNIAAHYRATIIATLEEGEGVVIPTLPEIAKQKAEVLADVKAGHVRQLGKARVASTNRAEKVQILLRSLEDIVQHSGNPSGFSHSAKWSQYCHVVAKGALEQWNATDC